MPNYYVVTHNPIARAGVVRALMSKGYSLGNKLTVSDYFRRWPAAQHPVVMGRSDGSYENHPVIDLLPFSLNHLLTKGAIRIPPNALHLIPKISIKARKKTISAPVLPEAAKYSITYEKKDGTVGNYTISNPIESKVDSFTAYAFGGGVRTFLKSQIRSFSKVS